MKKVLGAAAIAASLLSPACAQPKSYSADDVYRLMRAKGVDEAYFSMDNFDIHAELGKGDSIWMESSKNYGDRLDTNDIRLKNRFKLMIRDDGDFVMGINGRAYGDDNEDEYFLNDGSEIRSGRRTEVRRGKEISPKERELARYIVNDLGRALFQIK